MKLIILIGPTHAGKSTYAQTLIDEYDPLIISSDKIREELNLGYSKEEHIKVFAEVTRRCKEYKTSERNIVLDATNMNMRNRRSIFDMMKATYTVECHIIATPLYVIFDRTDNKHLVLKHLKSFSVPCMAIDCHDSKIVNMKVDDPLTGIVDRHMFHSSPHHLETVYDHIEMCKLNSGDDEYIRDFATYHDIGKYLTKSGGKFYSHANVSSYIALTCGYSLDFARDIGMHMHDGHWFRDIDGRSRVEFPIYDVIKHNKLSKWNITRDVGMLKRLITQHEDKYYQEIVDILKYRSAVYNEYGQLIQVGFPKFFNVDEFDSKLCKPQGKLRYYNKYDGSLILVTKLANGELLINSRGSLMDNEYVRKFKSVAALNDAELIPDTTYLYELIGWKNAIVVNYSFPLRAQLLATVDHKTIELTMLNEINEDMASIILNSTNTEGVVIQDANGLLFKIKNKEYMRGHNMASIAATVSNIANLIHTNKIDDIVVFRSDIKKIYDMYIVECGKLEDEVMKLYKGCNECRKEYFASVNEVIYRILYTYVVDKKPKDIKYVTAIVQYVMN